MHELDLTAYFKRIGYEGPRRPTLDVLQALHLQHAQMIAFENLSPLGRRPVDLDLPSLERKLVHEGRGGYCFEQNALFSQVLQQLGFKVTGLAARVVWNNPEHIIRPRGHMLLQIELNAEPYIADVGFGGQTLTGPLRVNTQEPQRTPHEMFRLITRGADYLLQSQIGEGWKTLYRFDLHPQLPVDYEVPNWYLSNHPDSTFINNLMVARPVPGKRYGLFNNQLTTHTLNGPSEQRALSSAAEIRSVLQAVFGLTVPDNPALEAALTRLSALP